MELTALVAVKANPDDRVLHLLAQLGTGFDCASKVEIQQVLGIGVDPSRIIYAQPCKAISFIRYAAEQSVKQMTFDSTEELWKIKQHCPDAKLFLRIITDDSSSPVRLSMKFGASLDDTAELLQLAKELGLNIVGLSFHVGSGGTNPSSFVKALQDARFVFDQAAEFGFQMSTLDIGGGFTTEGFETMAAVISATLDELFPPHVRVIGEPGRYYVSRAFHLACHIVGRRTLKDPVSQICSYRLYLNDGVYGNFSNIVYDHQHPTPKVLRCGDTFLPNHSGLEHRTGEMTTYAIFGQSCDGMDMICQRYDLPDVLNVGDWLYFENMGGKLPRGCWRCFHLYSVMRLTILFSLHDVFGHAVQRIHQST